MKAFLKNYRQSPRKVRLVGDAVKGKRVADAMLYLSFLPKRAAEPMKKLVASAVANAKQAGENTDDLVIASLTVDKGIVLKRMMPRARGSAFRINKRSSHITLTLAQKTAKTDKKAAPAAKKAEAKPKAKKTAKKTDK
ncbi:MAG: 50S ribosomal protein L22 [Candidatus Pacebacteria bacterium]|nr:50S ribosomal protein L22 [Candidatus Paceibacterota bacterium]MBP9852159.1 50S ribosomal protein L22 [Candidatus Paceibacterota bacterium]